MHGVECARLLVVLEQGEAGYPEKFPARGVDQIIFFAQVQTQLTQNRFGFNRIVGNDQDRIARFGLACGAYLLLEFLLDKELITAEQVINAIRSDISDT